MYNTLMKHLSSEDDPDPSPTARRSAEQKSIFARLAELAGRKSDPSLRETIEEYIEEDHQVGDDDDLTTRHERLLFSNILRLRDLTVYEVMVPRADIKALDVETQQDDILKFFASIQVSRVPVYEESLDNVLGTVHLKDILSTLAEGKDIVLKDLVSEVPAISPSMPLLDLLLIMRQSRRHMAMVADEYGGIDGLVTIGDVIESIVGEIDDEHDLDDDPIMLDTARGVLADARVTLEEFEGRYGALFSEEEREEIDTLGGLVFDIAGRVPVRGEILTHDNGMLFEIIDADPRKINRLRIRNIPERPAPHND